MRSGAMSSWWWGRRNNRCEICSTDFARQEAEITLIDSSGKHPLHVPLWL